MVRSTSLLALATAFVLSSTALGQSASTVASGLQSAARNIPDSCSSSCKSWLTTLASCPTTASSSSQITSFEKCVCTSSFLSQSSTCFSCFSKAGSSQSTLSKNLKSICSDDSSDDDSSSSSSKGSSSSSSAAGGQVNAAVNSAANAQPTTVIAGSITIVQGVETGGYTVTAFKVAQQTQAASSSNSGVSNAVVSTSGASRALASITGLVVAVASGAFLA